MAEFTWDIENPADRARYFWPRERVLEWWDARWYWERPGDAFEASPFFTDMRFPARIDKHPFERRGKDFERQLEAALGEWLIAFPADGVGRRLWDPFHLPLFDPTTGALSPKHPEAADAWDPALRDLFRRVVHERMADAASAGELCPLIGVVLPPYFNLSFGDINLSIDDSSREQPRPLSADVSAALIGPGFSVLRRTFARSPANGADAAAVRVFGAWRASFADAGFWGARFAGNADFWDASFAGTAAFGGASFAGAATFGGARFAGDAGFHDASFTGAADFGGVRDVD